MKSRRECRMLQSLAVVVSLRGLDRGRRNILTAKLSCCGDGGDPLFDLRIHLRDVFAQPSRGDGGDLPSAWATPWPVYTTPASSFPTVLQAYFPVDGGRAANLLPGCATLARRENVSWAPALERSGGARRHASARTFSLRMIDRLLACVPSGFRLAARPFARLCCGQRFELFAHSHLLSQRRIQETRQGPRPHLPRINLAGWRSTLRNAVAPRSLPWCATRLLKLSRLPDNRAFDA